MGGTYRLIAFLFLCGSSVFLTSCENLPVVPEVTLASDTSDQELACSCNFYIYGEDNAKTSAENREDLCGPLHHRVVD